MNSSNLDELVNWINDDSKVLTKKEKKKLNKNNNNKETKKKQISQSVRDKLKKYSRKENPYYEKKLSERIQLQKEYKKMLDQEKLFKDNKMQEIMNKVQNMSESERNNYLNTLLNNNEIELN